MAIGLIIAALGRRRPARREPASTRSWFPGPGLGVTPVQFWTVSLGAGSVTFLLVFGLTSLLVVSLMPALVVATLPRVYFGRTQARRVSAVQAAWPDGLRDIISSVKSGASLPTALNDLARFGPMPLREAFSGFPVYARSLGFVPALELVKADLSDPASDRVLEVLILAYERGGAVVPEILADLSEATTRDLWAAEQIATEALEQKINSRVVFILPWLVLIAMTAQSGAFREFYGTPIGIAVVAVGGVMSMLGILIAGRLGRQPVEPRVLKSETER